MTTKEKDPRKKLNPWGAGTFYYSKQPKVRGHKHPKGLVCSFETGGCWIFTRSQLLKMLKECAA